MSAELHIPSNSSSTEDNTPLQPPASVAHLDSPFNSLRGSETGLVSTPPASTPLILGGDSHFAGNNAKEKAYADTPAKRKSRVPLYLAIGAVGLVIVALAVVLPVYFTVIRPKSTPTGVAASDNRPSSSNSSNGGKGPSDSGSSSETLAITGGDGSLVTTSDGSTFKYQNSFGGFWYYDPSNPFTNGARPQSWVPALNETWTFGKDQIRGVNLGGWFVLEPFISPALYEKYQNGSTKAVDEWTLSQAMREDTSPGGSIQQIEQHYQTFITEKDFADIVAAGLNWVRIPIPFWAIDVWDGEPFLEKVCWKYILQALEWARKYGLRVLLDLHTTPGSQNGFNHSGKDGQVDFLNGVMGLANAERMMGYIRTITEFISQPQYVDLIPMFGIINEPLLSTIGKPTLTSFYLEVHDMMRSITGIGTGKGPYIAIHDGFTGISSWADFLPNSDRIALDTHPYFAFSGDPNTDPLSSYEPRPCNAWAEGINASQVHFGVTVAGEFSNAINDCGLYVRGVGGQPSYGGDCSIWEDASQWDPATISGLKQFALSSMDSLQNYFFWTWKIGNSTTTNTVRAPLWSYQLGLEIGIIPRDPREAVGACNAVGVPLADPFDGTYSSWQTGGAGAGAIDPTISSQFPWPPMTMAGIDNPNQVTLLPTYTSTAPIETLPTQTFTFTTSGGVGTVSAGNGWANPADTQGGVTTVLGCTYPNAWDALDAPMPSAPCPDTAAVPPIITPPPAIK